jgi:hypothetical protein
MRAACAALLIGGLAASPARAQTAADLIDGGADVVVVGSPLAIGDALASFAALGHGLVIGVGRQALKSAIGWDVGDPAAWEARGFDPAGDIWISLSVDDGKARYEALTRAKSWNERTAARTPAAFWHLRVIAPVRAPRSARALATAWGRRFALGAGNVRVSQRGKLLVLDALRPMFHGAGAAPPASDVTARARAPRPGARFARATALAGSGLRGWMRAGAVIGVGRAVQREVHIEIQRGTEGARGTGPWKPNPRCVELSALVDGHLFTELSWRLSPKGPTLELVLGAASRAVIDRSFPLGTTVGLRAHRHAKLAASAALRLAGFAGLRALPRPPAFESFTDALPHMAGCESHYGWTARLFGWPHLIGLFFDEIAALGPRGKTLAGSMSSAVAGTASWDVDPLKMIAVLEGSLAPAAVATAVELLELAFDRGRGDRWGAGRMRAYLRRSTPAVIGTSLGGARGAGLARGAAGREWLDPKALAGLRVDLAAARPVLERWEPGLSLLGKARSLSVDVHAVGAALRARISLSR